MLVTLLQSAGCEYSTHVQDYHFAIMLHWHQCILFRVSPVQPLWSLSLIHDIRQRWSLVQKLLFFPQYLKVANQKISQINIFEIWTKEVSVHFHEIWDFSFEIDKSQKYNWDHFTMIKTVLKFYINCQKALNLENKNKTLHSSNWYLIYWNI